MVDTVSKEPTETQTQEKEAEKENDTPDAAEVTADMSNMDMHTKDEHEGMVNYQGSWCDSVFSVVFDMYVNFFPICIQT